MSVVVVLVSVVVVLVSVVVELVSVVVVLVVVLGTLPVSNCDGTLTRKASRREPPMLLVQMKY